MAEFPAPTEAQQIAYQISERKQELTDLEAQQATVLAAERPAALAEVRKLVALYSMTATELHLAVLTPNRKRRADAGVPRGPMGPRKAKAPQAETEAAFKAIDAINVHEYA